MYSYVEYLRAVRALRVVAIVLGLLLACAVLARLSWGQMLTPHDTAAEKHAPTAHVTRTALPNDGTRTVSDDPKKAEIRRIGRPSPVPRDAAVAQSVTYAPFEFGVLFSLTLPFGLFAATLLAGPLAKENNGHLELAWTKPVSRERYAVSGVLVDLAAVAVAQVAAGMTLLIATCFWEVPKFSFDSGVSSRVLFALVAPMAWYACLTAFSTLLKRGPGAVLGIGWVVAVVCPAIAAATRDASTPVGRSLNAIFHTVSYVDPIRYIWFPIDGAARDPARATLIGLLALAVLAVLYLCAAVLLWRRVEA